MVISLQRYKYWLRYIIIVIHKNLKTNNSLVGYLYYLYLVVVSMLLRIR